jgi:hypothetical protein
MDEMCEVKQTAAAMRACVSVMRRGTLGAGTFLSSARQNRPWDIAAEEDVRAPSFRMAMCYSVLVEKS